MRKIFVSAIAAILAAASFAAEDSDCVSLEFTPGSDVTFCKKSLCKMLEEAQSCVNCRVLARFLGIEPNAVKDSFSFQWPEAKQLDSVQAIMAAEKKSKIKPSNPLKNHSTSCIYPDSPERQIGRRPFHKEDYLLCVYKATSQDQRQRRTVADLARDFHSPAIRLAWYNDLKENSILFEGQNVLIPDPEFTYYRYWNRLPFGNRDLHKLWPMLRCFKKHPELIPVLEAKIANGDYTASVVQSGERCDQWVSGNYIISNNGVCAFAADSSASAMRYDIPVSGSDSILIVKIEDHCNNSWLEWTLKEPEIPTAPPVVDTIPVSFPPVVDTIPYKNIPPPDTNKTILSEPNFINNLNRLDVWASDDRPFFDHHLAFDRQGAQSYGIKWDCLWQGKSRHAFGFTAMADGWDGESRSGFHYAGFEGSAGPLLLFGLTPALYWGIEPIGAGMQFNWGLGSSNYKYGAYQTNGFLLHSQTLDAMWRTAHLSIWATGKWAFAANKESRVNGVPQTSISDPADNNSGADGGMRFYFLRHLAVEPLIVYRTAYALSDGAKTNSIGPGIAFWHETLIFELSFKNRFDSKWDDNNGNAIEFLVNWSFGHGRGNPDYPTYAPASAYSSNPNDVSNGGW